MQQIAAFLLFLSRWSVQATVSPAGQRVDFRLESSLRTDSSNAGDAIVAVVAEPIRGAGRIIVPEGSLLNGRVETIQSATGSNEGRVRLVFREIQLSDGRTVSTWITKSFSPIPRQRNVRRCL